MNKKSEMNERLAISVLLPVLNETRSLKETVDTIREVALEHVHEILIVVSDRTEPDSVRVARKLQAEFPLPIRIHTQQLPRLGGALQEVFAQATGTHVLLMASDLETDPRLIPLFIETMLEGEWDIVAGSRWISGGGFDGYGRVNRLLNYLFQLGCRAAYSAKLTDLTFGYRLYRREALQNITWEELGHPFLLECLLKPLRLGARVTEVPCAWQARQEGGSANSFQQKLAYLWTATRIRLMRHSRIHVVAS